MDLGLDQQVFVVTGGGRGLGRATADLLVAEGARVVLSGRDQETVGRAAQELGDNAVGVAADNADPATADRLVTAAKETWGRLDGALISVGGPPPGSIMDTPDEAWSSSFDSVFLGALRIARAVATAVDGPGSISATPEALCRTAVAIIPGRPRNFRST